MSSNQLAPEGLLTPREVAKHYGVPIGRVYAALRDGRLRGIKIGWGVVIQKETLPAQWPGRGNKR